MKRRATSPTWGPPRPCKQALKLPQCPCMYLHSVRVELSLLHETILRVDIVATNVAWESVKANFLVLSCSHFNLRIQ